MNREHLLIDKACSNTNDADQVVNCVVKTDSLVKETAYQVIDKISNAHSQSLPLLETQNSQYSTNQALINRLRIQTDLSKDKKNLLVHTCLGEEFEAKGQIGQLQSSTVSETNVTVKIAWIVETMRLQKSKERLKKIFLINTKAVVHEITPNTIKPTTSSPML